MQWKADGGVKMRGKRESEDEGLKERECKKSKINEVENAVDS